MLTDWRFAVGGNGVNADGEKWAACLIVVEIKQALNVFVSGIGVRMSERGPCSPLRAGLSADQGGGQEGRVTPFDRWFWSSAVGYGRARNGGLGLTA
jgi:hypothetical protein